MKVVQSSAWRCDFFSSRINAIRRGEDFSHRRLDDRSLSQAVTFECQRCFDLVWPGFAVCLLRELLHYDASKCYRFYGSNVLRTNTLCAVPWRRIELLWNAWDNRLSVICDWRCMCSCERINRNVIFFRVQHRNVGDYQPGFWSQGRLVFTMKLDKCEKEMKFERCANSWRGEGGFYAVIVGMLVDLV